MSFVYPRKRDFAIVGGLVAGFADEYAFEKLSYRKKRVETDGSLYDVMMSAFEDITNAGCEYYEDYDDLDGHLKKETDYHEVYDKYKKLGMDISLGDEPEKVCYYNRVFYFLKGSLFQLSNVIDEPLSFSTIYKDIYRFYGDLAWAIVLGMDRDVIDLGPYSGRISGMGVWSWEN